MNERRIAVYLEERHEYGTRKVAPKAFVQIQMNHSYHNRLIDIIEKTGGKKTGVARDFLMTIFQINSISELREAILYAANSQNKKPADICKIALKRAIDQHLAIS